MCVCVCVCVSVPLLRQAVGAVHRSVTNEISRQKEVGQVGALRGTVSEGPRRENSRALRCSHDYALCHLCVCLCVCVCERERECVSVCPVSVWAVMLGVSFLINSLSRSLSLSRAPLSRSRASHALALCHLRAGE